MTLNLTKRLEDLFCPQPEMIVIHIELILSTGSLTAIPRENVSMTCLTELALSSRRFSPSSSRKNLSEKKAESVADTPGNFAP